MALRSEGRVQSKVCILRMRFVPFMDSTAIHNLEDLYINLSKQGARLILSGVNERVLGTLQGSGLSALIGEEYICRDIHRALEVASKYLQKPTEAAQ